VIGRLAEPIFRPKGLTVIAQRTLELSGTEQSAPGLRDQIKGRLEDTDRALGPLAAAVAAGAWCLPQRDLSICTRSRYVARRAGEPEIPSPLPELSVAGISSEKVALGPEKVPRSWGQSGLRRLKLKVPLAC